MIALNQPFRIAVCLVCIPGLMPPAPAQDPPTPPFQRLLTAVEAQYRRLPNPADTRAAAARLGHDPDRICAFVREEIAYEPYRGILRGSAGTLSAGAGNSIDQALLLAEMLAASGVQARIRSRAISPEEARRLARVFLAGTPRPRPAQQSAAEIARALGLDAAAVEAVLRKAAARTSSLLENVRQGAARESARLAQILGERLAPGSPPPPDHHCWVEISRGGESRLVDPTGADLSANGREVVLVETALAALRRTVAFRLILDRAVGDKIESVDLLHVSFPVETISYKDIDLIIHPEAGQLPRAGDLAAMPPPERVAALRRARVFRSGILVDGRSYGAAPFDLEGKLYEVSTDGRVGAAKALAGGIDRGTGGLGRAFGGGGPDKPPASRLQSVRLEVTVSNPGGGRRLYARMLYQAGRELYPLLWDSILIDTHSLPHGETARRALGALVRNSSAIRDLVIHNKLNDRFKAHSDVSPLLLRFTDLRRAILDETAVQSRPLREHVGIVRESRQIILDPSSGRAGVRHMIDLMENAVSFVDSSGGYVARAALRMGVADTALEWLLLIGSNPADAVADLSAWVLMERARLLGGQPSVERADGSLRVRWSEAAWWNVDPATGHSVGRAIGGGGQAAIEYAWNSANTLCEIIGPTLSMFSAAKMGGYPVQWANELCSIVQGTYPRDKLLDEILETTSEMWMQAIEALAGAGR